jgi:hypothetical protein
VAAADVNLSVKVQGDEIVVTLPGTSYVVTYYRAAAFPQQLLTKSHSGREDEGAPMTQAEFQPAPGRRQGSRREHCGGSRKKVWRRRQQDARPISRLSFIFGDLEANSKN